MYLSKDYETQDKKGFLNSPVETLGNHPFMCRKSFLFYVVMDQTSWFNKGFTKKAALSLHDVGKLWDTTAPCINLSLH